jgi:hypothetical protein
MKEYVQWPEHHSHDAVPCFNCGHISQLTLPVRTKYPAGHGQWRRTCDCCHMKTWYDLIETLTLEKT